LFPARPGAGALDVAGTCAADDAGIASSGAGAGEVAPVTLGAIPGKVHVGAVLPEGTGTCRSEERRKKK